MFLWGFFGTFNLWTEKLKWKKLTHKKVSGKMQKSKYMVALDYVQCHIIFRLMLGLYSFMV